MTSIKAKMAGLFEALWFQLLRAAPALSVTANRAEQLQSQPDTMHLVDPDLLPWVVNAPTVNYDAELVAVLRRAMAEQVQTAVPEADGLSVRVSEHLTPDLAGAVGVRVLLAKPTHDGPARPGVLYIHGGGFIVGNAGLAIPFIRQIATALDCLVAAVDYRLAPENPFPAPLEDCYAALAWFAKEAPTLGLDPARIAVMGESSGAGLAAALALLTRDRGGPRLAFQSLLCPMLDDRTVKELDPNPVTGQFIWNRASNRYAWTMYLGSEPGSDSILAYAAPARAVDLSGLPPAHIQVGTLDLFFDEDLTFARRLARAGVPVALEVYPGAYHGFELMYPAPAAKEVQDSRLIRLSKALQAKIKF